MLLFSFETGSVLVIQADRKLESPFSAGGDIGVYHNSWLHITFSS